MFFLSLFLIGACFGSFLCLVAERLPEGVLCGGPLPTVKVATSLYNSMN